MTVDSSPRRLDQISNGQILLEGHTDEIMALALAPDGNRLASAAASASTQCQICVWDLNLRKCTSKLLYHVKGVVGMCFSPSGKYLATVGSCDDNAVAVWDVQGMKLVATAQSTRCMNNVVWHPKDNGSFMIVGDGKYRRLCTRL